MARRVFSLLFSVPWIGAVTYRVLRHPGPEQALPIAAVFGSLLILVLAGTVLFPLGLRQVGEEARADDHERAATEGAGVAVFSTFLWSMLFLPLDPKVGVTLGVAGAALALLAATWAERRLRARRTSR